jgi:hypothetical protein
MQFVPPGTLATRPQRQSTERGREKVGCGSERHYNIGGVGNNNFRFEGFQALPVSPSDKSEA